MKQRSRRMRMVEAVLLTILTALPACGSPVEDRSLQEPSSTSRLSADAVYVVPNRIRDATMVWSTEPGIDLYSDEGTVTRAALESFAIGMMVGLDYTYLGFAASSKIPGGGRLYGGFDDDTGRGPFVGTIHGHIQRIIPTDTGFDVISCLLSVGLDVLADGKYSPSRISNGEGAELRSRFFRTVAETSEAPAPSRTATPESGERHWQAPTGNQFVDWGIDGFTDRDPSTSGSGRCVPWARSLYPDTTPVIARDAYANDNAPPVQPAYPGWPDDGE
ncbi:hypothetical protein O1W68_20225 [Rhodococcus sp. H36-A4]|uniref:hypothetical protein n=1 Tax=Rhodococcus sp. H36-A4 TaxID=3004353 RepID=UPI0022AF0735|nr:hypothetical protein [Rhodococcus sp. H36-A4]MCZ4080278.1 hypothetical protein [Rhodococcus sp. H36-A4]